MLSSDGIRLQRTLTRVAQPLARGHVVRRASSKRWVERQSNDRFAREARVQGLKSRAAFKLLQINEKYRLFKPGQTVVDLGYAPGSWSQVRCISKVRVELPAKLDQVAIELTKPHGRVVGVDIIPAQPPKGVSTIQGNFLSPDVQHELRTFLRDPDRGRVRRKDIFASSEQEEPMTQDVLEEIEKGYIDQEKEDAAHDAEVEAEEEDANGERMVDVVLSDMWEPWEQTSGFWKRTLTAPYVRMMNTSGNNFRDHASSMVRNHQVQWRLVVADSHMRRTCATQRSNSALIP